MNTFRLIYKLFGTILGALIIIIFVPPAKGLVYVFGGGDAGAHRFVFRAGRIVGKYLTRLFSIKIHVINKEAIPKKFGYLITGNHVGYAELLSIASLIPIVFVAKEEVKKWPLLGLVFRVGGEVFVDRESGGKSDGYAKTIQDALEDGVNIFFAPEGTTSDGTILRHFKSPLFVPANRLKRPVLPFAFYPKCVNGEPVSKENRDKVLWHSEMSFTPHFFQFLKLKSIDVTIEFADPIVPDYDDTSLDERRKFATEIRAEIHDMYLRINPFYSGNETYSES